MGKTDLHIDLTREDEGSILHRVIEDIDETSIETIRIGVEYLLAQVKAFSALATNNINQQD